MLIKDVTVSQQGTMIRLAIRWQTNACTTLELTRPLPSHVAKRTAADVIERIRALAPTHTEAQIAEQLNAEGFKPGASDTFTAGKVNWIRFAYRIANGCPQAPGACRDGQRGDGRYSAKAAAELLNVDVSTVADWCNAGHLDFVQSAPHGPRWILLTPERLAELRKPYPQRKPRRNAP